jgi:myosin heavy subunit
MAEHAAGFRLYADSSSFERGMANAAASAEQAGKRLTRAFDAKNLGTTLATAIGLNLGSMADKLVAPFREAAEAAKSMAEFSEQAATAQEKMLTLRQTDNQQLADMERKLKRLLDARNDLENKGPSKSFLGGIIDRGSAFDKLFGFSRREDAQTQIDLARNAKDIPETQLKIEQKKAEVLKKEVDTKAKLDADAMKAEKERLDHIEKEKESKAELDEFDRAAALERMASEDRIIALKKDEAAISAQIQLTEREVSKGTVLSEAGNKALLELKKKLAEVQSTIKKETKAALTDEQKLTEEIKKQIDAKNKLASIVGVRGNRQFGDAADPALQEQLRRNQQAIDSMGALRNIGQDFEVARLQAEMMNIRKELAFRAELRGNVANFGVEGARSMFGGDPLAFDRLVQRYAQDSRDAQKVAAESNELLRQMNERQKTGLPVINLNA